MVNEKDHTKGFEEVARKKEVAAKEREKQRLDKRANKKRKPQRKVGKDFFAFVHSNLPTLNIIETYTKMEDTTTI